MKCFKVRKQAKTQNCQFQTLGDGCVLPWNFSRGRGVFKCMVTGCWDWGSGPALPLSSLPELVTGFQDAADACGGRTSWRAPPMAQICETGVIRAVTYRTGQETNTKVRLLICVTGVVVMLLLFEGNKYASLCLVPEILDCWLAWLGVLEWPYANSSSGTDTDFPGISKQKNNNKIISHTVVKFSNHKFCCRWLLNHGTSWRMVLCRTLSKLATTKYLLLSRTEKYKLKCWYC